MTTTNPLPRARPMLQSLSASRRLDSYWNRTGLYQETADRLLALLQTERSGEQLRRFEKAAIAYCDLYNNGGGNANRVRGFKRMFGVSIGLARLNLKSDRIDIEKAMDRMVIAAAKEQDVPVVDNPDCQQSYFNLGTRFQRRTS
jgi:hypothetical protein